MLEHRKEVDSAFLERHSDGDSLPGVLKMNILYDLAKTLFNEKYSHLEDKLKRRADEQHDAELEEWNMILEDVSLSPDTPQ